MSCYDRKYIVQDSEAELLGGALEWRLGTVLRNQKWLLEGQEYLALLKGYSTVELRWSHLKLSDGVEIDDSYETTNFKSLT